MKSWLQDHGIEIYSTHNEGKSAITKRFIRILKHKIYKDMTAVSKNVHIHKCDDIVNKYNNTYHRTIKTNTHIDFEFENNDKDPKCTVGNHVRISKHKKTFTKCCTLNWFEDAFITREVKDLRMNGSGSGIKTLTILYKEMEDIMKIVQSLEDSGLLIKSAAQTIKNEEEEQRVGSHDMLLGILGASLLGNLLTDKGIKVTSQRTRGFI